MPKIDLPPVKTAEPELVYVTIPQEDLIGMLHPKIIVSGKEYLPGQTYKLPLDQANWIESRIKGFTQSQIKLNRNTQDRKSLGEVGQVGSSRGGTFVNPNSPEFS